MIELRWLDKRIPTTDTREFTTQRTLQYRALEGVYMDASGAMNAAQAKKGSWIDVPEIKEDQTQD